MILYYAKADGGAGIDVRERMLKRALGGGKLQTTDEGEFWPEAVHFSFSRSGALSVLLVDEWDCGVDAEPLDGSGREVPLDALTEGELAWLQDQVHNSMTLWTRKEAARKAVGDRTIPANSIGVLERDNSVLLNGTRLFLGSFALEGCVVSWASRRLAMPELRRIDLEL